MYSLGAKIKLIRKKRNLSQKELGVMCGYPESNANTRIAHYETNSRIPNGDNLIQLAHALNVNPLALNESSIQTQDQLMHTLFDLQTFWGLQLDEDNGKICLSFDNPELNREIRNWFYHYQDHLLSKMMTDLKIDDDSSKDVYDDWIWNYPHKNSDIDDKKLHLRMKIKSLVDELNDLNE